ncbi:hypothetical protein EGW08_011358 [Elysia chlorotica]|uniref:Uncharacterized protein n=1 Tax=Elysia chlorotica TaxID=188477 RepID=A0A3S1BHK3_ELYCH|nr:hypothetical protein EGW08_011358 [Elysia chlorotica]
MSLAKYSVTLMLCLGVWGFAARAHHPCGENPLRRLISVSRILSEALPDIDRDMNSILGLLRSSHPQLYRQIQDEWRSYASCVGLVDTGYFKRSSLDPSGGAGESRPKLTRAVLYQDSALSGSLGQEADLLLDILQGAIFQETDAVQEGQIEEEN